MLRGAGDEGCAPSAFQHVPWRIMDGAAPAASGHGSANLATACWYPSWSYPFGAVAAAGATSGPAMPLVVPVDLTRGPSASPALCRLPLPWANCGWSPLPAMPAPVVLSSPGGASLPTPSTTAGLDDQQTAMTAQTAVRPIVSLPGLAAGPMPVLAPGGVHYTAVATTTTTANSSSIGEATSEETVDSTEPRTKNFQSVGPDSKSGDDDDDDDRKESDGEDVEVDVEGSDSESESTVLQHTHSLRLVRRSADVSSIKNLSQSAHKSVIPNSPLAPRPSVGPNADGLSLTTNNGDDAFESNRLRKQVAYCVPSIPAAGNPNELHFSAAAGVAGGRSGRRPLLPDVSGSSAIVPGQPVRLAFTVTRGQNSPEHGCGVCGSLSCGSRSANRGQDNPPRRQYFSCKVARRRLLEWINVHKDHPYPTKAQRAQLLKETGMNRVQLQNWLGNHRRRLKAQRAANGVMLPESPDSDSS